MRRSADEDVMDDGVRLKEIEQVLERLRELSADHVLLIEGKKDREALNTVGVRGDFFQIQSAGGPVKAVEYVAAHGGKAVILTDWDRKGGVIAGETVRLLIASDLECDSQVRADLARLCRHYIKDVEALDSLVARLAVSAGKLY
ncbi:MAG: Toprim subdomain protein [Methanomethylophilus sp.]|nr:Toprim subdomain protein [Methanomethylophilus sp.]MDD4222037.1 Toprim subdomain protein [Methanomethylophilus sp.]